MQCKKWKNNLCNKVCKNNNVCKKGGKKWSKKAFAVDNLATMLLIIAFIIPGLIIATSIFNFAKASTKKEMCTITSHAKYFSKFGGKSAFEINCPATSIVFRENEVIRDKERLPVYVTAKDGKKDVAFGFNKLEQQMVYKAIADEMVDCWQKFGQGKDVFDQAFLAGGKKCARCSHLHFDPEIINQFPNGFPGLYSYLKNNNPKRINDSYYGYLNLFVVSAVDNVHRIIAPSAFYAASLQSTAEASEILQPPLTGVKTGQPPISEAEAITYTQMIYHQYDPYKLVLDDKSVIDPSHDYYIIYFIDSKAGILSFFDKTPLVASIFFVKVDDAPQNNLFCPQMVV